jgi:hypothetical protein
VSPWGALAILLAVVLVGAATCVWALLAAVGDSVDEWESLRDDHDE